MNYLRKYDATPLDKVPPCDRDAVRADRMRRIAMALAERDIRRAGGPR